MGVVDHVINLIIRRGNVGARYQGTVLMLKGLQEFEGVTCLEGLLLGSGAVHGTMKGMTLSDGPAASSYSSVAPPRGCGPPPEGQVVLGVAFGNSRIGLSSLSRLELV